MEVGTRLITNKVFDLNMPIGGHVPAIEAEISSGEFASTTASLFFVTDVDSERFKVTPEEKLFSIINKPISEKPWLNHEWEDGDYPIPEI